MDHSVQVDVTAQGTVRVVLTGSVILVRHDEVLARVEQAMKAEPSTRMSVDLSRATSLDSSGVALLLLLRRRANRAGVAFQLHDLRPEVRQHLHMAGLTAFFGLATPGVTAPHVPERDSHAMALVEVLDQPFGLDDIRVVRHRLSSYAASVGMSDMDQYKLMLAATEIMANAVRHGGGRGHIRVVAQEDHLLLEISDEGPGIPRRYLEAPVRPRPGRIGLAGLWLVREICDRFDVETGPGGTTVRLTIVLPS
ncbi:ATP-binding protein [Actinoplanes sp. NBC_00393]|uniref:ATP-binding protein n=1 Tax=Actinoplanes sp. NBC_00393 TaxID=2975953 RepID=UPI002E21E66F